MISSSRSRQGLLRTAYSAGLTHFDTAPLYGFGLAEHELGKFLACEPNATVATKVGLYPPGGADQAWLSTQLRKAAGKAFPAFSKAQVDFGVKAAETSLTGSLRRLGREQVELLFVHEPNDALMNIEEWQMWLEREKSRGRIAASGLAGEPESLEPFVQLESPLTQVLQSRGLGLSRVQPQIIYGLLAGLAKSGKLFSAAQMIANALRENSAVTVLVSTLRESRILEFQTALDLMAAEDRAK